LQLQAWRTSSGFRVFRRHGCGRNGVAIWDLTPERLLDAACTLAGRNLTGSKWDTYLAGLGGYRPTCPDLS
jgi:hypothetical protein